MTDTDALVEEAGIRPIRLTRLLIGGNTAMGHLLLGYSCEGLGVFPFTPVDISLIEKPFREVLEDDYCDAEVILLPGISTYVGGDIVSGLTTVNLIPMRRQRCWWILARTARWQSETVIVSYRLPLAAGPAFEGGNISWGMGSVQVRSAKVETKTAGTNIATIGDKPPIGLLQEPGVIETISGLIEHELVDETGSA